MTAAGSTANVFCSVPGTEELVEQGVVPSDDAINMLIFEPGFSTAEQVTNLSGRGVGMDVVRRNIEALRGSLRLTSNPGQGLQVDIRLPLTLAIIDGFLVGVGKAKFVLPLESVVEVIEAGGRDVKVDALGATAWSFVALCCRWYACATCTAWSPTTLTASVWWW